MPWRRRKRRTKSDTSANEQKSLRKQRHRLEYSVAPPFSTNEAPQPASRLSTEITPEQGRFKGCVPSAFSTTMPSIPSTSVEVQSRLFQLPREIRDLIWLHYCYSGIRKDGPLAGYVDIPSPAPLAVCKQMHTEVSPIFYESLKHALVQDRVCLRLQSKNLPGYSRFAGWNLWYLDWESSSYCFNIWVRDGTDEGDYAAWWVDARNLCSLGEFAKFNTPLGGVYASQAFAQLVHALNSLQTAPAMLPMSPKATVRLRRVAGKVQRNLKDIKEREVKASTQPAAPDSRLDELPPPAPAPTWWNRT